MIIGLMLYLLYLSLVAGLLIIGFVCVDESSEPGRNWIFYIGFLCIYVSVVLILRAHAIEAFDELFDRIGEMAGRLLDLPDEE